MAASQDGKGAFVIAQISDLHCGGPHFLPNLLERAINEVNDLNPDIVVVSGDLTTFGLKAEYAPTKSYLDRLESEAVVAMPGNLASRWVTRVDSGELFGDRRSLATAG